MLTMFEICSEPGNPVMCLEQNTYRAFSTIPFALISVFFFGLQGLSYYSLDACHLVFSAILSCIENVSSLRIFYFKLPKFLFSTCNPSMRTHHTPALTELVQMPLMGESLLIFPKCLENSLLVSPITLTFSYD